MSFEREFPFQFPFSVPVPHGNRGSWSSTSHGMTIPDGNGIENVQGSWTTGRSGIERVGERDPTFVPRRPMPVGNENFWNMDSWYMAPAENSQTTILQGNGIGQMHTNERSKPVPVEMQENQLETENWFDLIGTYTELLQEKTLDTDGIFAANGIFDDMNQPPPAVHNHGNQNGVASMTETNLTQAPNDVPYEGHTNSQASSFSTLLTSTLESQETQRLTSNNLISNRHSPRDGFPVTDRPNCSLGSPPRLKPDDAELPIIESFPVAPITPDNTIKSMNSQHVPEKVNFSDEETSTPIKNKHGNQTVSIKDAENLYNELLQTLENSPPSAVSTTQKDYTVSVDKDEQGNDLNATPAQKTPTRRRKHRPKVIREGKPKRAPRTPKNSSPGEIRVKRKYVKKKGVNNSNENTPVESIQKRKYVRRKGVNGSNEKTPAESVQTRKLGRKKSTNDVESKQESTVDDTPHKSCKKQLNFDSQCVTQDKGNDSKYSQQDANVPGTPLVKARHHSLNVLARSMSMRPNQDRRENSYDNKVNVFVHQRMQPTNLQGTRQSFTREGVISLDAAKGVKRSCDQMSHNASAMNSLLLYQKMLLRFANHTYNHNHFSTDLLENNKKMKMQSEFVDNSRQMRSVYGNRPAMEFPNFRTKRIDPSCKIMNVGGNGESPHFRRPMAATHYLLKDQLSNGMQPHMMRPIPERSQKYTQREMISWNAPTPKPAEWTSRYAVASDPKLAPNSYNQRLNELNRQQHHNNSLQSCQQSAPLARGPGRPRKQNVEISIDVITHMLERLQIYEGAKKQQNELVLYKGSEAIIPFVPIKKRNRRPKVDLDPESERLWNLLMGSEGSEGAEKLDQDKEKWWENERQVFRGRADSFIARMHLVQGDRRFSRWKGSVVDSVIGVFLTQNVSDHLSSSAFMSLAAKFPLKSTAANKTCCQDDIRKCHEEITSSYLSKDMARQFSTRGAEKIHSRISEEETILSRDIFNSSNIQIIDEWGSSSGSNSEADDVITGIETLIKRSSVPQIEKPGMLKDISSNDYLATNMYHPPKGSACNMQIPRWNGINLTSSPTCFQMGITPGLPSSNPGVTEACYTSNVNYRQNDIPNFQTPSQGHSLPSSHPSKLLNTNQYVTDGALKQDYAMFGGTPVISVEDSDSVANKQNCFESTVTEANSKTQNASRPPLSGSSPNVPKARKETPEDEIKNKIDWDSLRRQVLSSGEKKERSKDAKDTIDYEALRRASVDEISDAIRERGMNNLLADRMKDFLNRLARDHGSIDLEWLRDAPPDKAKDYLLSFRGLGLKSVECVRLLTLHHLAFPVDTNVGRIAVRLGWVPLQPLPESLQLHLLEMYPVLESIQKYLWPRLCKLDQLTLYELHYQMITFGKVFCTKSKPNCNACPMRGECRHFASAFASARLSLPGPEEKGIVISDTPVTTDPVSPVVIRPMPLLPAENESERIADISRNISEPIIEEPATPEPEANDLSISDIEDQYYEDSDEIPIIKLNMKEFTTNLQNIMQDGNDMSKALVALNPKVASIPTPKLKDVSRLRTEHLVYELPDSHQLLEGLDKREPDDPSPYLLAIWTPGETANSVQPPEIDCPAQRSGQFCDRTTCFSCNSVKEANSQVVRGTILIPCRTAMRGSFPLNGTYFQVNEMFADHASSLNPINVPRAWIWNLQRRKVYFGTSVTTIFRGLTTEGIQYCFWKGFVCVRGFDRIKRAPRPLIARLHFPASKLITQKTKANK